MSIVAITGTNTDVGKTIATAALALHAASSGLEAIPVKPVQTGETAGNGDIATVEKLTGVVGIEFVRYPEPLAPNLAAKRANMQQLDFDALVKKIRELDSPDRLVLVEGAGGLLVRLADEVTLADIAVALGAPLVVVTSLGLGSLNLAELTVEAARRRGLHVAGLIGGSLPVQPDLATRLNLEEMSVVTGVPLWACLPEDSGKMSPEIFAEVVSSLNLPDLKSEFSQQNI
ncbi:ATP-dependent dethiobiotin synthetase BioD [Corynebacterium pseudotuberculosis 258]|uniref:ATP-dependent dethiobiotin synthetase BioD n=1 Tax=Corynebacterium pseudotuberculosis 258 TaxID=1168865 RepID=A0AAU8Q1J3_CORPS|nr:dethiobiotin synthase [Corynebacterium pseudotuberculosis]AEQ06533.1 ATP-dependent dethiobiotin synthetase BioD [Corynebacterium pseudotuberculosis CIP 52.97]AFK16626.1 ATP-dependent dethiobiotin synthetase BioD [Corynebacterium pseudotuberculosis 258]